MTRRLRFKPCARYGCPETAVPGKAYCTEHLAAWRGRTGTSRWEALGCSPRTWTRLARACRARDGHICRICGAEGTEVDHLIPTAWRKPPFAYRDHLASLMLLCHSCHLRKTTREAVIGTSHGSPPPPNVIAEHIHWWLGQARTIQTVQIARGPDAPL